VVEGLKTSWSAVLQGWSYWWLTVRLKLKNLGVQVPMGSMGEQSFLARNSAKFLKSEGVSYLPVVLAAEVCDVSIFWIWHSTAYFLNFTVNSP